MLIGPFHEGRTIGPDISEISVCNGWTVDNFNSHIDWGDNTGTVPINHPPGFLTDSHTYATTGDKNITISTQVNCNEGSGDFQYPPLGGTFKVTIYDTLPVSKFSFRQPTIKGGAPAPAHVELTALAPGGGSTVTLTSNKTNVIPNSSVVVPPDGQYFDFDVPTKSVARNTRVTVTAAAGGNTFSRTVVVTP